MVTKTEVFVSLSNLQVLDCKGCNQPLTIPVFQCKNGHTACYSCYGSLRGICATCGLAIDSRCSHLEEIIESHKVPCPNKDYGCKELMLYRYTKSHAKYCDYEPYPCPNKAYGCPELINFCTSKNHAENCVYECYPCPEPGCTFKGLSNDRTNHFFDTHSYEEFDYGELFTLELGKNQKICVLGEAESWDVFVLNNEPSTCGGAMINVSFVSLAPPTSKRRVLVEVAAGGNVLKFCGPAPTARSISDKSLPPALLHISSGFLASGDAFSVNLKINSSPLPEDGDCDDDDDNDDDDDD